MEQLKTLKKEYASLYNSYLLARSGRDLATIQLQVVNDFRKGLEAQLEEVKELAENALRHEADWKVVKKNLLAIVNMEHLKLLGGEEQLIDRVNSLMNVLETIVAERSGNDD